MACKERLLNLARQARRQEEAAYKSFSGADRTDAERHRLRAVAFGRLASGDPVESVLADMRRDWESHCREVDRKIAAAPKLRYGPMAGCSAAHYLHCDPGRIDGDEIFIRNILDKQ